jgi:hypothetical protein
MDSLPFASPLVVNGTTSTNTIIISESDAELQLEGIL